MQAPVAGYQYPLWQVWSSVQWYLLSSSGYRCIGQHWKLLAGALSLKPPGFLAVRQWVLRLGHYKLHQAVERADDWVFIVDYTHQIGLEQCLLVLGVRLGKLRQRESWLLGLPDVQVLDISLCHWANGEHLRSRLERVSQLTGAPAQIVADGCSSIKKGIRLYEQALPAENPPLYTYDISHQVALLLEALLEKHAEWLLLQQVLNQVQKAIVQTHAAFLAPPSLRKTARYMNLFEVVEWTGCLLAFHQKGEFSLLATTWQVGADALDAWSEKGQIELEQPRRDALLGLEAPTEQAAARFIEEHLQGLPQGHPLPLRHNGHVQFQRFFAPLIAMRPFLLFLQQLMELVKCLLSDFKEHGLSKARIRQWQEFPAELLEEPARLFFKAWLEKMQACEASLPGEMVYLATSDIIESIFGHYKATCDKYWLQGISANILMMPAFVGKLNVEVVHEALLKTRYRQVEHWFNSQRLEKSFLVKRRKALSRPRKGLKTVGTKMPRKRRYETA